MSAYDRPRVLSSYDVEELVREAATCASYKPLVSDEVLKQEVETVQGAVDGIRSIRP